MEQPLPDFEISFVDPNERQRSSRAERQVDKACSVRGCGSPCFCRRLCRSHYNRVWRYGQTKLIRTKKKKKESKEDSDRLQLLKERHRLFLARREQERRQHEFLARGCDEFASPWGDDG